MTNTRYCRICEQKKPRNEFGLAYCIICEKDYKRPNLLKYNPHICEQCQTAFKYRTNGKTMDVCKDCYDLEIKLNKMFRNKKESQENIY